MDTLISKFTYSEFLNYTEKTPRVKGADDIINTSSENEGYSFTGTRSYEEALKLARYGWEAGIKELEIEKDLIVDGQTECVNGIAGGMVDVGRYLSGNPECMIQFVDKIERDKPELIIYTGLSYSAFHDQKEAQKYAKRVLKIIVEANQTYSVKLVGFFSCTFAKQPAVELITIKDFYQQFVLNNLAFSYHPSFFRRLWFRHAETKPYRTSGYGSTMSTDKIKEILMKEKEKEGHRTKSWLTPLFQEKRLDWSKKDIFEF